MRRVLIVLMAAGLAVTACGDDDDDGGLSATTRSTDTSTTTAPADGSTSTSSPAVPLDQLELTLTEVGEADSPTALVARAGTESLYVAEREGRVREVTVSGSGELEVADDPILDISDDVVTSGEQGLLDIEFSTDGSVLYVSYSIDPSGDTRIAEYPMRGNVPGQRRELLAVEQPFENHNGGDIEMGPDEFLYVALGDGGDAGDPDDRGQDTGDLLGKILRIDPTRPAGGEQYGIPAGNPFADGANGRPEIWLYGVRNPWRISFDRSSGDLWVADVGQNEWEEINLLPASSGGGGGANLGWNQMEGTHEFEGENPDGAVLPVFEYSHDEGCSVTGGVVYRGTAIPGLTGAYLFGDFCAGELRALRADAGGVSEERTFDTGVGDLVSFGEDSAGEVYVLSLGGGIYRLDAA
jgi:glucose/arabinose dehydrogenase